MKKLILLLLILNIHRAFAQTVPVPAHLNDDVMQKMGFKDPESGEWAIKPIFDHVKPFGPDGTAVVFTQRQVGFVDLKGTLLFLSSQFHDAENFNQDGLAVVRRAEDNSDLDAHMPIKDKYGAVDKKGRIVIPIDFDFLNGNSFPGTMVAQKRRAWGIINIRGGTCLEFKYHMINVHKSLKAAIVRKDSLTGVIDATCKFVVPMDVNLARFAGYGLISTYNGRRFGWVNFSGETVIPYEYNRSSVFKEGTTLNKKNGYYGIIDTLGKVVIPFEYDAGEPLVNDTAVMVKQGKAGIINGRHEVLVEFVYDKISRYYYPRPPGGYVLIRQGIYYYLDPLTGKPELWEPSFPSQEIPDLPAPGEEKKKEKDQDEEEQDDQEEKEDED